MSDRCDPDKDAIDRARHGLPPIFGDAVMADPNHLISPSIGPEDGEERFKAVGVVDVKLYTAVFVWRGNLPRFSPSEGATLVTNDPIILAADPSDAEDFDVSTEALDRGQKACLVRTVRTRLGLSQVEFARRFHVPLGTLRDWEQARATSPDLAMAYVRAIMRDPDMVAAAVA